MPGLGFLHRTAGRFCINRFCPFADILWFSQTQTVEQSCTKTLLQPPFGFDSQAGFWHGFATAFCGGEENMYSPSLAAIIVFTKKNVRQIIKI